MSDILINYVMSYIFIIVFNVNYIMNHVLINTLNVNVVIKSLTSTLL